MSTILPSTYNEGTISVAALGTVVTGVGTTWVNTILPGDFFSTPSGLSVRILEVTDNTHLTLAYPWPGPAVTTGAYEIRFQADMARMQETSRQLLQKLMNGNIDAFAGLTGAADAIPMFTGPGAMTLISRTDLVNGVNFDVAVDELADRAAYDTQAAGYTVLVADNGDGRAAIYFKNSNASGNWSNAAYVTGVKGDTGLNWQGNWSNAATYAVDDAVFYNNSSWIALVANTNVAPVAGATWGQLAARGAQGAPGTNGSIYIARGTYSGATAYAKDDTVLYNGSTFVALQATTGNAPPTLPTTSNTWWQLVAQKGTDGSGTGDVVGPAGAVTGRVATFNGATGKLIADGGKLASDLVTGPASSVATRVATFADTSGKVLSDSGVVLGDAAAKNTGTAAGTVAAGNDTRITGAAQLAVEDQVLTGGARVTSKDLGTITTGTVTPDPGDRPLQHYTNNGAHTLAPGTNPGSYLLDITNGASAGAITLTGWTKTAGDAFTTTSGNKFRCHCSVGNGGSLLIIQALQ